MATLAGRGTDTNGARLPTPTEDALLALLADVVGVSVGVHDPIASLGAHFERLRARIATDFGVELPTTIAGTEGGAGPSVADLGRCIDAGFHEPPKIERVPAGTRVEPTFAQRAMLAAVDDDPGTNAWNMRVFVDVQGAGDFEALIRAVRQLLRRHDGLRTWFERVGERRYLRERPVDEVPFRVEDLRGTSPEALPAAVATRAQALAEPPFDQDGVLLHAWLGRTGEASAKVALFLHHAVLDVEGVRILVRELPLAYRAEVEGRSLPPVPTPFVDFAAWQAAFFASPPIAERLRLRRAHLAGCATLALPCDAPAGAARDKVVVRAPIGPETLAALRGVAADCSTTLPHVTQAIWAAVLHGITGAEDVPVAMLGHVGPRALVPGLEGMVGLLGGHAVMRHTVPVGGRFSDLLRAVRTESLAATAAAALPAQLLLGTERPFAHPAFATVLNYIPPPVEVEAGGVRVTEELAPVSVAPKTTLVWIAREPSAHGGMSTAVIADLRRFTPKTAERIAAYVGAVASHAAANGPLASLPRF